MKRGIASGILRGIQYTDDRNRLAQEREDKLEEMRYNRERQQKQDEMQRKQFEFTMQNAKQEATKAMIPFYAEMYKSGVMNDDISPLIKMWKGLNLGAMTGEHAIEAVSEADRQDMIKQGILGPNDNINKFIKTRTTSPDGTQKIGYKDKSLIAGALFGKYFTDKDQKDMLAKLTLQGKQADIQKANADIKLAKAKTETEKAKANNKTNDPTKALKVLKAAQEMKAREYTSKIFNGEQVDIASPDFNAALQGEIGNIKNTKVSDELDTLNSMTQRVQRALDIKKKMENVDDQSFYDMAKFTLSKMKNLVTSYSSKDYNDETTKTDDPKVMSQYLERIGLESSLAGYLADLIKEQSGAAVNEAEVQRKALELIGGNKYLINKETMLAAFSTHIEDVKSKIQRASTNSLYKNVAPLSYYKMGQTVKLFDKPTEQKKERKPLSSFMLGGN